MKIGLAQINSTIGDLENNVDRCLSAIESLSRMGAGLVILPELAVPGYPPRDILYNASFIEAIANATTDLAARAHSFVPTIVGTVIRGSKPTPGHPGLLNVAALAQDGIIVSHTTKQLLPAYDVFHETRWFHAGGPSEPQIITGTKCGLLICEDLWHESYPLHPPEDLRAKGAEILISISASPYRQGIINERLFHAHRAPLPVVFVNSCGAQDELIFDGRSFVTDGQGNLVTMLPAFEETVKVIDLDNPPGFSNSDIEISEELFFALVTGVREFAEKNNICRAFLGLSGGIDSALTSVIAAEAMGSEKITAIAMPSRFTDDRSTNSARELARSLGIGFEVVPITTLHETAETCLTALLDGGTTAENIQARLRAMVLMAHVNHHGGMLLNTSNKTELTLGYSTLYGDMAGSLCPIADLTKPEVTRMAQWINEHRHPIPAFTLERPPTAELKANQVDPFDYQTISPELEQLVRTHQSNRAMLQAEHKRWQMGVILKVSEKAFGTGRMIPITRR